MLRIERKNSIFLTDLVEYPIFQSGDYTLKIDVRYLSERSKQKAEAELNETSEVKDKAIKDLSELIKDEENLDIPYDMIHFLLIFLRARKFNVSETFDLVKKHYSFKKYFPELFIGVIPSKLAHIYAMNSAIISPSKDQDGQTVLMAQAEKWDPNIATPMQLISAYFVTGEQILMEPESQVNGFVIVVDCKGFSHKHLKNVSLKLIKICIRLMKDVIPGNLRRVHLVNQNSYVDCLYKLVKPFLSKEFIEIIHFHGQNLESLHKFVPKECLLECFGGTVANLNASEEEYRHFLQQLDAEYHASSALGYKRL